VEIWKKLLKIFISYLSKCIGTAAKCKVACWKLFENWNCIYGNTEEFVK